MFKLKLIDYKPIIFINLKGETTVRRRVKNY